MKMQGKSVVVTGASSGMGDAIVRLFVAEGASVVAVARRKERLEALKESLTEAPGTIEIYPGDVSDQSICEGMIDFAVEKFGKLDVLINNAGVMDDMSPIGDATNEKYEKVMAVNMFGPFCAMRKAVNVFLEQGNGGSIVNVASLGGMRTCAGAIYCASKAAVISMTKNTAYMYMKAALERTLLRQAALLQKLLPQWVSQILMVMVASSPCWHADPKWAARKILPRQRCSWQAKILLTSVAMFW